MQYMHHIIIPITIIMNIYIYTYRTVEAAWVVGWDPSFQYANANNEHAALDLYVDEHPVRKINRTCCKLDGSFSKARGPSC